MPKSSEEVYTSEIQHIIGKRPSFLIRWGNSFFLLFFIIFLFLSYIVKYPEIISVNFKLVSNNLPQPSPSKINGRITKILVRNRSHVTKGDVLAYMESNADHNEVLNLYQTLLLSNKLRSDKLYTIKYRHLGELQSKFQEFIIALQQNQSFKQDGLYNKRRKVINKDAETTRMLIESLQSRKKLLEQDLLISIEDQKMQRTLLDQKVIAPKEYRLEESRVISKRIFLEETNLQIISSLAKFNDLEKQLLEIDDQFSKHEVIFQQSKNSLMNEIKNWKEKYIVTANVNGIVNFSNFLTVGQIFSLGQDIMYVSPTTDKIYGEIIMPNFNLGKIKVGQKVVLKLDSYPYQEYGVLYGYIENIYDIPVKDGFVARVKLSKRLITSYNKQVNYKSNLTGQAEIILEDTSLMQRLFFNLRRITI